MKKTDENNLLLRESRKIVEALGKMFAPFCEVALHDLTCPDHAIVAIENNTSGRKVGDPATEIGLARIMDPSFPEIIQNYPNRFPDGRAAKSTSIGIKSSDGKYVAAICLNLDISLFSNIQQNLEKLIAVGDEAPVKENLHARSAEDIQRMIEQFAAQLNKSARGLSSHEKRSAIQELHQQGFMHLKNGVVIVADCLGISRATVYNCIRSNKTGTNK